MPFFRPGRLARLAVVAALANLACGSPAVLAPGAGPAATPTAAAPPSPPASASVSSSARAPDAGPEASLAAAMPPGVSAIETECNGVDDDHDGLVDVLLRLPPNACTTEGKGACHTGWAACERGQRLCLAPPPMPEVFDGLDNDCNGVVDDVATVPATVHARALVLVPKYAWADAAADIATSTSLLEQAGIPYDRQATGTDWDASLAALDRYALAIVPGYLITAVVTPANEKALEDFVKAGGVLLVSKPVGESEPTPGLSLLGLRSTRRRNDVTRIRFDAPERPAAFASVDSVEERTLEVSDDPKRDPVEVYVLEPDPAAAGVTAVAHAFAKDQIVGAAITRRALGRGAVYALGHDLTSYGGMRCYINCFEPGADALRLLYRNAFLEAAQGHAVMKHTAPGAEDSVVFLTHDVDAPDSHNAGEWGAAGAVQMAEMERRHGVKGTYNVTTDYVKGYYNPQMVRDVCAAGMCPIGGHSVQHLMSFGTQPYGTCTESAPSYGPRPTLCGEIEVSSKLLADASGAAPRVWRSPFLLLNPRQFDLLARDHFIADSSLAIGDLRYNLPVNLETIGFRQDLFHHRPLYEFPIVCEDGIGHMVHGALKRDELDASTLPRFWGLWMNAILQNAANGAMTTVLVHPSRGMDEPVANLGVKVDAVERVVILAQQQHLAVLSMEDFTGFWRAREQTAVEASYDDAAGYTGALTVGATPITGLTLEFGDAIKQFTCAACGAVHIEGKRVVLGSTLAAGLHAGFTATAK